MSGVAEPVDRDRSGWALVWPVAVLAALTLLLRAWLAAGGSL